jgi:hypothetical protein
MLFGSQPFSSIGNDKITTMLFGLTFGHYFSMINMPYRVPAYDDCAVTHLEAEREASPDNSEGIGESAPPATLRR